MPLHPLNCLFRGAVKCDAASPVFKHRSDPPLDPFPRDPHRLNRHYQLPLSGDTPLPLHLEGAEDADSTFAETPTAAAPTGRASGSGAALLSRASSLSSSGLASASASASASVSAELQAVPSSSNSNSGAHRAWPKEETAAPWADESVSPGLGLGGSASADGSLGGGQGFRGWAYGSSRAASEVGATSAADRALSAGGSGHHQQYASESLGLASLRVSGNSAAAGGALGRGDGWAVPGGLPPVGAPVASAGDDDDDYNVASSGRGGGTGAAVAAARALIFGTSAVAGVDTT